MVWLPYNMVALSSQSSNMATQGFKYEYCSEQTGNWIAFYDPDSKGREFFMGWRKTIYDIILQTYTHIHTYSSIVL